MVTDSRHELFQKAQSTVLKCRSEIFRMGMPWNIAGSFNIGSPAGRLRANQLTKPSPGRHRLDPELSPISFASSRIPKGFVGRFEIDCSNLPKGCALFLSKSCFFKIVFEEEEDAARRLPISCIVIEILLPVLFEQCYTARYCFLYKKWVFPSQTHSGRLTAAVPARMHFPTGKYIFLRHDMTPHISFIRPSAAFLTLAIAKPRSIKSWVILRNYSE